MSDQKILKKVGFLVAARDLAVEYGEETKLNEVMSGLQAELAGKAWICSSCGQVFFCTTSGPGTGSWCPGAGSARAAPRPWRSPPAPAANSPPAWGADRAAGAVFLGAAGRAPALPGPSGEDGSPANPKPEMETARIRPAYGPPNTALCFCARGFGPPPGSGLF